jgi:Zn ribbon nucleic-acid-binding protein
MSFDLLLDAILGERQISYIIECPVCGFEEIYYEHNKTKKLLGRACSHCQYVQLFDK